MPKTMTLKSHTSSNCASGAPVVKPAQHRNIVQCGSRPYKVNRFRYHTVQRPTKTAAVSTSRGQQTFSSSILDETISYLSSTAPFH